MLCVGEQVAGELAESVGPMLEEALSEEQVNALCSRIARMFKGVDGGDGGGNGADASAAENGDSSDDDYLVKCENIIMAFAGRVLLKRRHERALLVPIIPSASDDATPLYLR